MKTFLKILPFVLLTGVAWAAYVTTFHGDTRTIHEHHFNAGGGTLTELGQSSLERSSASTETFNFSNPGAGIFELRVDNNKVMHIGNDGSGSLFDADFLDSLSSAAFGQLAAINTWTSLNQFENTVLVNGQLSAARDPSDTAPSSASVYINPTTSAANEKFLAIEDNGADLWTLDKEGDQTTTGTLLVRGNVTLGKTAHDSVARLWVEQSSLGSAVANFVSVATGDDPNFLLYQDRKAFTSQGTTWNTLWEFTTADNTGYLLEARILGRCTTTGDLLSAGEVYHYIRVGSFRDTGASTAQVGSTTSVHTAESAGTPDVRFNVSGASVQIQANHNESVAAGEVVSWHVTVKFQSLSS